MEYNKLRSLDEFINESNELLKAQDACKAAMFQIQKPLDKILDGIKNMNIIDAFKTVIKPYNTGYEILVTYHVTSGFFKRTDVTTEEKMLYDFVTKLHNIFIQPGSFFQDYIDDAAENLKPTGDARLEGKSLPINDKDYNAFHANISNKEDIKKAIKKYVDENLIILNVITKLLK